MLNKNLHTALQKLTKSTLALYNQKLIKLDPQFPHDRTHLFLALSKLDNEIKQTPQFSDSLKIMRETKEIKELQGKLVGTRFSKTIIPGEEICILSFIQQIYFKNTQYSLDLFDEEYLRFEDLFYSQQLKIKDSTALYNFQYEENEINLSDEITIKKKNNLYIDNTTDYWKPRIKYSESPFLIERRYKTLKDISSSDESPIITSIPDEKELIPSKKIFDLVIDSLRVLKSSGIYRSHEIQTKTITFHPHAGVITNSPFFENIVTGGECKITPLEAKELAEIFKYIISEQEDGRFSIAVRRLSSGIERRTAKDKLIDYMIGFEALYLPKQNNELTFRLSLRAAFLLEKNSQNRKETFKFLKHMYNTRSKIVHGDSCDLTNEEVFRTEKLLRDSIKLWIKDKTNFSEEKLDNKFFE